MPDRLIEVPQIDEKIKTRGIEAIIVNIFLNKHDDYNRPEVDRLSSR